MVKKITIGSRGSKLALIYAKVAKDKKIKARIILIGISLLPLGITNLISSWRVFNGVNILSFEENTSAFFI